MNKTSYDAILFATEAHGSQMRKVSLPGKKVPYILHPLRVARNVASCFGWDGPESVAALLHDVVEDTPVTLEEVDDRFGEEVSFLVSLLSDDKSLPYEKFREHKIKLVGQLHNRSYYAIKLADQVDNIGETLSILQALPSRTERDKHVWNKFRHPRAVRLKLWQDMLEAFKTNPVRKTINNRFDTLNLSMYEDFLDTIERGNL